MLHPTYTVTITFPGSITASETITFSSPDALTAVASVIQKVCTGTPDVPGEAQVLVTGGISSYTFLWSNSQITPTATGLTASIYLSLLQMQINTPPQML